ncbi:MAG: DUF4174 domain-containing protein [Cyclobacteriaceae bacterium]
MGSYLYLPAFLILSFVPAISIEKSTQDFPEEYTWKNRLLLIFSPTYETSQSKEQVSLLMEDLEGKSERDLLYFQITDNDVSELVSGKKIDASSSFIRKSFGVATQEFSIVLIGKDGGIKLKQNQVLQLDELYGIIDAMPMRQAEINRKQK